MQRLDIGETINGVSDDPIFDGHVSMKRLISEGEAQLLRMSIVTFERNARTRWHSHDCDQLLIVTKGVGIVADVAEELEIRIGDAVIIPAGERHWHGSGGQSGMTHLSILTPSDHHVYESVSR